MKTLIVYFSSGGSTKIVARTLSMNLKANILEIKDLKDRKGFGKRLLSYVVLAILLFSSTLPSLSLTVIVPVVVIFLTKSL